MNPRIFLLPFTLLLVIPLFAQTPAKWLEQGNQFKKQGQYKEAFPLFRQAAEKEPSNVEALYLTGWCANELEDWPTALHYLDRAFRLKEQGRTYFEIGYALSHQQKAEEALAQFTKALQLIPEDPQCLLQIANLHFEADRHQEALPFYERYLKTSSPNNYYFFRAAWVENEIGRYRPALAYLEQYEPSANADRVRKAGEEGFAWMKLGEAGKAEEKFGQVLKQNPEHGGAWRGLGEVYKDLKKEPRIAIGYYRKAVEVDEAGSAKALYHLGWLYNEVGVYDSARTWLEKAVVRLPGDHDTNDELGYSLLKLGQHERAVNVYQTGLELQPNCPTSLLNLGLCYVALKRFEEARSILARLRSVNPDKAAKLEAEMN